MHGHMNVKFLKPSDETVPWVKPRPLPFTVFSVYFSQTILELAERNLQS